MIDTAVQVVTAAVSVASLVIAIGAYRRSGPRIHVGVGRSGWIGPGDNPAFSRAIAIDVINRGDSPVTVEHWGFEYCNRCRLPTNWPFGMRTGIGMNSVDLRKGDVPHRLEPGGEKAIFAMPLAEIWKYMKPPGRLRAYVIVGHSPRRIRSRSTVPVANFAIAEAHSAEESLFARIWRHLH